MLLYSKLRKLTNSYSFYCKFLQIQTNISYEPDNFLPFIVISKKILHFFYQFLKFLRNPNSFSEVFLVSQKFLQFLTNSYKDVQFLTLSHNFLQFFSHSYTFLQSLKILTIAIKAYISYNFLRFLTIS